MKRSSFFRQFIPIAGLAFANPVIALSKDHQEVCIYEGSIAGAPYYDAEKIRNKILRGDPLTLKREPTNHVDEWAIEIYWKSYKIGYIAQIDNLVLANMMDEGIALRAELSWHYEQNFLRNAFQCAVYMKKEN